MDRQRYDTNTDPVLKRHQNENADLDPDRYQDDAEPQHWFVCFMLVFKL